MHATAVDAWKASKAARDAYDAGKRIKAVYSDGSDAGWRSIGDGGGVEFYDRKVTWEIEPEPVTRALQGAELFKLIGKHILYKKTGELCYVPDVDPTDSIHQVLVRASATRKLRGLYSADSVRDLFTYEDGTAIEKVVS